uniref:Scol-pM12A n=1 Tax=Scolopendra viridis TaxID=118503 RepID=A0A4D5R9D3_SCOVI
MTFLILVATLHLLQCLTSVNAQAPVSSNDPRYLACPEFSITEEATITSPLYPQYYQNFYCEYNIQAPKDRYVVIHFNTFSFPPRSKARRGINYERIYPRCEKDFLEISDDHQYINKFRYCNTELQGKDFISHGNSVKLILQTMDSSNKYNGFSATIKFPVRENIEVVNMQCSNIDNRRSQCAAPLNRVMTPESSVQLIVNHRDERHQFCSKEMTLTTEYLQHTRADVQENQVMMLDDVYESCIGRARYPSVMHLTKPDTIVYDVSVQKKDDFAVILKQFSTKQIRMCGDEVFLKQNETYNIDYKAYRFPQTQTCMWILHADPTADKIEVEISKFQYSDDSRGCAKHHLSMMHIGVNMFEILRHELKNTKDVKDKYKRICDQIKGTRVKKQFVRPDRDIYGALSLMILLSHSDTFIQFSANVKSTVVL